MNVAVINKDFIFPGTTPDPKLCDEGGKRAIAEIKCPYRARNWTLKPGLHYKDLRHGTPNFGTSAKIFGTHVFCLHDIFFFDNYKASFLIGTPKSRNGTPKIQVTRC